MEDISLKRLKEKEKQQAAKIEGWLSLVINLILFGFKYWAGIVSGSLALIADGWHTLSDSITSLIVLIGARISCKPADEEHPYGHGRAELIATILIGSFLAIVSVEFIKRAIELLGDREGANYGNIAIIAVIISIISKEILAQIAYNLGKKHKLSSLTADAHHHRSDALSSLVVFAGILAGSKLWWMDAVLSLMIAVLIGYTAYKVIINAADGLLGKRIDRDLLNEIEKICEETEKEIKEKLIPHHYHLHCYGSHQELIFHLTVPGSWEISYGHSIADKIESRIRTQLSLEPTIHLEPR